jgi:hypothetical protein
MTRDASMTLGGGRRGHGFDAEERRLGAPAEGLGCGIFVAPWCSRQLRLLRRACLTIDFLRNAPRHTRLRRGRAPTHFRVNRAIRVSSSVRDSRRISRQKAPLSALLGETIEPACPAARRRVSAILARMRRVPRR